MRDDDITFTRSYICKDALECFQFYTVLSGLVRDAWQRLYEGLAFLESFLPHCLSSLLALRSSLPFLPFCFRLSREIHPGRRGVPIRLLHCEVEQGEDPPDLGQLAVQCPGDVFPHSPRTDQGVLRLGDPSSPSSKTKNQTFRRRSFPLLP